MRLREFQIEGFAQHGRTIIVLRDDQPNLILGPNESGKSHLMRALTATLFGMSPRQAEAYVPWHGEPVMRGRLRLEVDGDEIEIDRRILDETVTVTINGSPVYDGRGRVDLSMPEDQAYRQLLLGWVGFGDADVFERTVFVGQDLLQDDRLDEMSGRIKQIISGSGETSYDAAIRDLEEALGGRNGLRMGPRDRSPRRLESAQARLAELQSRFDTAARVQSRVGKLRDEEIEHQRALEQAQAEQRTLGGVVEHAGTLAGLRREEERWRGRLDELERQIRQIDEIARQRDEREAAVSQLALPGDPDPDDVRRLGSDMGQAERRIADLETYMERERQRSAPRQAAPPDGSTDGSRRAVLLGAGLAVTVASLALGILIHPALYAGMIPGLIFILLGLLQRPPVTSQQRETVPDDLRSSDVGILESELTEERRRLAELTVERDQLLGQAGLPDLDALYERLRQYSNAVIRLDSTPAVDADERARLEKNRDTALQETSIARNRIERLLREHPALENISPEQLHEYRQRLEDAQQNESRARERLRDLGWERGKLAEGTDDAESLRLEIEQVQAEIAQIEELIAAHEMAISVLDESVRDFQENALDPVGEDAGRHFAAITSGRYSMVRLDKDTMTPSVESRGVPRVDHQRLSRGARDQLYLSIRIALIDALSGGRSLPLALDDPAVNFDEERLSATADLLREIARGRQVLLFSQDARWTRWFDPVARLPRPAR
jgi:hypothetical protein